MDTNAPAVKPKRKYVTKKMRAAQKREARRQRRAERLAEGRFDTDARNIAHAEKQRQSGSNQPRRWPLNMERWAPTRRQRWQAKTERRLVREQERGTVS